MKCKSDSNEGAEQSVKEENSLPGETNLKLHQKKFNQILEANVSNKFDPNEFLEVKENIETPCDTVTTQQYIKQESWNPWYVSSIFEFNYFCCPECDFSTKSDFKKESIQDFVNHASSKHPRALDSLQQIYDGSLDNITFPVINATGIKEEPQDYELAESEFDAHNFVQTELYQPYSDVERDVLKKKRKNNVSGVISEEQKKPKAFKCNICGKGYSGLSGLHYHKSFVHEGKAISRCHICLRKFQSEESLKIHIKMKHDNKLTSQEHIKLFECEICGKSYKSNKELKKHAGFAHEGKKPFSCNMCPKKFTTKHSLQYHTTLTHELKELGIDETNINEHRDNPKVAEILRIREHTPKKVDCKLCGEELQGAAERTVHVRDDHCDKDGKFKCPKCDLAFLKYNQVFCHVKTIHEKVPCSICGEMVGKSLITVHMQRKHKIDPPDKKFKCQYCGRGFLTNANLRDHENTHTGARPHLCKMCGKGFAHSGTYSRHIRSCAKT